MRLMIRLNDFSLPSILRDLQEILFYQFWDKEGDKEDLKTKYENELNNKNELTK